MLKYFKYDFWIVCPFKSFTNSPYPQNLSLEDTIFSILCQIKSHQPNIITTLADLVKGDLFSSYLRRNRDLSLFELRGNNYKYLKRTESLMKIFHPHEPLQENEFLKKKQGIRRL